MALSKLLAEIEGIEEKEGFISYNTAKNLPYLQATIKESMRLHPVVGILVERVVPASGFTLDGQYFPPGAL